MKPLAIDLFCGLGGWTEGLLAAGYDVIGFDIEQHLYGEHRYSAQLVLHDVCTLDGRRFKDASLIVASSPCHAYSYMAMPWTRAKQIATALRGEGAFPEGYDGPRSIDALNRLFVQPARIQREASAAAGRYIPMVQENVCGAQKWVGRAPWHYGSYYLWGDVPALMPMTSRAQKVPGFRFDGSGGSFQTAATEGFKTAGMNWSNRELRGQDFTRVAGNQHLLGDGVKSGVSCSSRRFDERRADSPEAAHAFHYKLPDGVKVGDRNKGRSNGEHVSTKEWNEQGGDSFGWSKNSDLRGNSSKSSARKAASARIAKIPFALALHIAETYYPAASRVVA